MSPASKKKGALDLREWLKLVGLIIGVVVTTIVWFEGRFVTEDELKLLAQKVDVIQTQLERSEGDIKSELAVIKGDTKDIQAMVTQIRIEIAAMAREP